MGWTLVRKGFLRSSGGMSRARRLAGARPEATSARSARGFALGPLPGKGAFT